MYELNLIRSRVSVIRTQKKLTAAIRLLYLAVGGFAVFLIVKLFMLTGEIAQYTNKIQYFRQQINEIKEGHGIAELEVEWDAYYPNMKTIRDIVSRRTNISPLLKSLSLGLPQGACLTDITLQVQNNKNVVRLQVLALAQEKKGFDLLDGLIRAVQSAGSISQEIKIESQERREMNGRELELYRLLVPIS
ncbi:MAG: hypothetical protein JW803_00350 [Endomicrobiales bacterium]|nr:hypothetical protein [Endomicrobiales bacterium]